MKKILIRYHHSALVSVMDKYENGALLAHLSLKVSILQLLQNSKNDVWDAG